MLDEINRDVAYCGPYDGFDRITLTLEGLSKAAEVLWLITGAQRAVPLAQLHDPFVGTELGQNEDFSTRPLLARPDKVDSRQDELR